jgi:hypothetical protein
LFEAKKGHPTYHVSAFFLPYFEQMRFELRGTKGENEFIGFVEFLSARIATAVERE